MSSKPILKRVLLSLAAGLLIAVLVNEITFFFLRETARPPKTVELVIPAGAAEQVSRGEQPPSIPEGMIFVVGDTLVVKNEDSTSHELGPLFIPAGSSASLVLDTQENYSYSCSFRPNRTFGLDVREPLTPATRVQGILFAGLPLGVIFALYSFVAWPLGTKGKKS